MSHPPISHHTDCWCGQPATWTVEIDPAVTPWDHLTVVDEMPAMPRCDDHVNDSMGAAHPIA